MKSIHGESQQPLTTHQNQLWISLKGFFTLEVFLEQESYFSTMERDRVTEWMRLGWMFQHHGQRHRGHACCISEQLSIYHKVSFCFIFSHLHRHKLRFTYTHIRPHNKQPFQPFHIPTYLTFNPQLKSPMLALKQTEHLTIFLIPPLLLYHYLESTLQIILTA